MNYLIKPHARKRMQERFILEDLIRAAIERPTKIGYDSKGRILIKKLYQKAGRRRLLLVVGEEVTGILEIITIIDTSNTKKYL